MDESGYCMTDVLIYSGDTVYMAAWNLRMVNYGEVHNELTKQSSMGCGKTDLFIITR